MVNSEADPQMLTVDEVADYLRVSRATVCRWCSSGKIPAFKIGKNWRVQRDDLELYIQRAIYIREQMPSLLDIQQAPPNHSSKDEN